MKDQLKNMVLIFVRWTENVSVNDLTNEGGGILYKDRENNLSIHFVELDVLLHFRTLLIKHGRGYCDIVEMQQIKINSGVELVFPKSAV